MKNLNFVLATAIVLLILLSSFSYNTFAQNKPIADETELIQLKSSFKVVTCNQKIMDLLLAEEKLGIVKYSVALKFDRLGRFKEYTISFKNELLDTVKQFFTKINK